jgi:predicted metal-dependent phosphoesterase TrpH
MTQQLPSDARVLRIDPHVHSTGSYDSETPIRRILERAQAVGLDGVVVTDHDAIEASIHAAELAPSYGLIGIPGVEVSTADGHLLALGVEERPPAGRRLIETIREIRCRGGIAVVPHPFQRSKHGVRRRAIRECDGIEIYNAHAITGFWNWRAQAFAIAQDYSLIGGSDAHVATTIGCAHTEVWINRSKPLTRDNVLTAIQQGQTTVCGHQISVSRYFATVAASVKRWNVSLDYWLKTGRPNR